MDSPAKPLLLISCSRRKTEDFARGRDWDVYDGALYRMLKKLFRQRPEVERAIGVLIVSARYGVIRAGNAISTFDERMTATLARQRGDLWSKRLRQLVQRR